MAARRAPLTNTSAWTLFERGKKKKRIESNCWHNSLINVGEKYDVIKSSEKNKNKMLVKSFLKNAFFKKCITQHCDDVHQIWDPNKSTA